MKPIDQKTAQNILWACGISLGEDFHKLPSSNVSDLLEHADRYQYRKPANANGSRARYFHDLLQRRAKTE